MTAEARKFIGLFHRIIFLIFFMAYPQGYGQEGVVQDREDPQQEVERYQKKLDPFQVEDKTYTVVCDAIKILKLNEESVESYTIVDEDGTIHHTRKYTVDIADYGFTDGHDVTAFVLESSRGTGLVIDHWFWPSAPGTGQERQVFVLRDGRLVPLCKPFAVYGSIEPLAPGSSEGARRLLDGDTMILQAHAYYFAVKIPVEIRLSGKAGEEPEGIITRPTKTTEEGYAVMETITEPRPIEGDHTISLYEAITDKSATTVAVSENSKVLFGPAYGTVHLKEYEDVIYVEPTVFRLKVSIDGREGFVEEKDYSALGLRASG
jgi:hypothetical protein